VSLIDLQYHDIRPFKGVYYLLARNDRVDRMVRDEQVEQAKHTPPQTTRARLRGEFIRRANLKGTDYRVDWVYLKLNDPERETILCKDRSRPTRARRAPDPSFSSRDLHRIQGPARRTSGRFGDLFRHPGRAFPTTALDHSGRSHPRTPIRHLAIDGECQTA
jgi:hypothetical protein